MIQDFLRRENRKDNPVSKKMIAAINKYEAHFGKGLNTEPSSWSEREWIKIIDICIEENMTLDELISREYGSDDDD